MKILPVVSCSTVDKNRVEPSGFAYTEQLWIKKSKILEHKMDATDSEYQFAGVHPVPFLADELNS